MQSNPDLPNNDNLWEKISILYQKNKNKLEAVKNLNFGSDEDAKKKVIESTLETAQVIGEIAAIISEINPVAKAVVAAYNAIVNRAVTQNNNEKKTWIVHLQMQNMMCELFRLRELQHVNMSDLDRLKGKEELEALLENIAFDINRCESDMDFYSKQSVLIKAWASPKFQQLFQAHIEKFSVHRTSLQMRLSMYMCAGINFISSEVTEIKSNVSDMHGLMGELREQMKGLGSKVEQALQSFIDRHGEENILNNEKLLNSFIEKAGEVDFGTKNGNKESRKERNSRIKNELQEQNRRDFNKLLESHFDRFMIILEVQKANGEDMHKLLKGVYSCVLGMGAQVGQITSHVLTSVNLKDEEFQRIWNHMKLSRSVKAKTFVLTFRDYYSGMVSDLETLVPPTFASDTVSASPVDDTSLSPAKMSPQATDSEWAIKYIDVTRVQQIVEAMDEDGSGFISVDEANMFASSRPKKEVSLIAWIAYWAAGWKINLEYYCDQIREIMAEMLVTLEYVHVANRAYVEQFLDDPFFTWIDGLLRSVNLPDNDYYDPALNSVAKSIREIEEQRLLANLQAFKYVLESPETIKIVGHSGRVETWILPLIYLLLQRQLKVIQLCKTRVLSVVLVDACTHALSKLHEVFTKRLDMLIGIFEQMYPDVGRQFKRHAYGMFYTAYESTDRDPGKSTVFEDTEDFTSSDRKTIAQSVEFDQSFAEDYIQPGLRITDNNILGSQKTDSNTIDNLFKGLWIGLCINDASLDHNIAYSSMGAFHARINSESNYSPEFTGSGSGYSTNINISGYIYSHEDESIQISFILVFQNSKKSPAKETRFWCKGSYNPPLDRIIGHWTSIPPEDATKCYNPSLFPDNKGETDGSSYGNLFMTRTPAYLYRLKANIMYTKPHSRVRRKALWKFAIQSVLHMVHPKRWSMFEPSQLGERDRWIELSIRARHGKLEEHMLDYTIMPVLLPPENLIIYHQIADYLSNRRLADESFPSCTSCENRILFSRSICITCIDDDCIEPFNLCTGCIDDPSPINDGRYRHHISHSIISSPIRILDSMISCWIESGRLLSEDIKEALKYQRAKEDKTNQEKNSLVDVEDRMKTDWSESDEESSDEEFIELICSCCETKLTCKSLPFWGCFLCDWDQLFCSSCVSLNKTYWNENHSRKHPLLRVTSSDDIIISETSLVTQIERRLDEMEKRISTEINARVSSLETDGRIYISSSRSGLETSPPEDGIGSDISSDTSDTDTEDTPGNSVPVRNTIIDGLNGTSVARISASRPRLVSSITSRGDPGAVDFEERLRTLEMKVESRLTNLENNVNDNFTRLSSLVQMAISGAHLGMQPSYTTSVIGPIAAHSPRLVDSPIYHQPVRAIQEPSSMIEANNINYTSDNEARDEGSIKFYHYEERPDREENIDLSLMPEREDFNHTMGRYDDPPDEEMTNIFENKSMSDEEEDSGEPDQEGDQQGVYGRSTGEEGCVEDDFDPEELYTAF